MKNLLLSFRSALLLLLLLGTIPIASGQTFWYKGIQYSATGENTACVVESWSTPYSGDIVIPSHVIAVADSYDRRLDHPFVVTAVDYNAFYNCSELTSIVLPNTVKTIGSNAFSGCTKLTSVTLSSSLETIRSSAFQNCSALRSIVIPNSVRTVEWNAFYNCISLTNVVLSDNITELATTFTGCSSLTTVKMPANLVSLNGTFKGCSSLESIILPGSLSTIGENTFQNCSSLTSVYIPNSVTKIGEYAFANTKLTSLEIPSTLTQIDNYAFYDCNQLTSITSRAVDPPLMANRNCFAEDLYSLATLNTPLASVNTYKSKDWWNLFNNIVGNESLNNVYDFTSGGIYYLKVSDNEVHVTYKNTSYNSYSGSVTIPATVSNGGKTYSVTAISSNAFKGCTGLTSVSLPSTITKIAAGAFSGCSGLTNLAIPVNVTAIASGAFEGCSGITQLTWNAKHCWSNGDMATGNINKVTIGSEVEVLPIGFVKNSRITALTIPATVTAIGKNAFQGCSGLTSLTVPENVTYIGEYAFSGCSALTTLTWNARECWSNGNMHTGNLSQVTIGNNVIVVPDGFASGSNISSVTFPNTVKHIGASAFSGCTSLGELNLPSALESIGAYAFNYCSAIQQLTIPTRVMAIGECAFEGCEGIKQLTWNAQNCFSNGNLSAYNITQVTIGNEVKSIPHNFVNGSQITSVIIPNSVDTIGNYAFSDCSALSSLSMGSSVTSIGEGAFYNCSALSSLNIGPSVASIGEWAFYGCSALESITVDNANKTYSSPNQCNAIIEKETNTLIIGCNNTVIPVTVTAIAPSAFAGCTGLTSIDIPESVTSIGYCAFEGCSGLKEVTMGSAVEYIGYNAFSYCSTLASVTCYALTPPQIDYYTFYDVPSSMVVYVPVDAVQNYQSNYYWKRFTIQPIRSSANVTVNLPANVDVSKYNNMKLAMTNVADGTTMHYVLSNKKSYTFTGIQYNTTWKVTLTNQYGDEFGRIDPVQVGENDKTVTFGSLLTPKDVVLQVIDPNGEDVTDKSTVSWYDEDGTLLIQGDRINSLPVGRKLVYQVKLPQELAELFTLPENMNYTVQDGDNVVIVFCRLSVIYSTQVKGKVIDAKTSRPISGAAVSAVQTFAGGRTKTLTTTTSSNGEYSISARKVTTTFTYSAQGYITETRDVDLQNETNNSITLPDVALQPITGALIDLHFTYTPAHFANQPAQKQEGYSDYANVDYEIFNKTKNCPVNDFIVQYPQIVLNEQVNDGDVLELTAKSRNDAFKPVKTTVTIVEQKADATFNIVQYGGIAASFKKNTNPAVTGSLYDADGQLVEMGVYNNASLSFMELPDGNYTLVTMGKSSLFNTMSNLAEYSRAELEAGVDYAISHVTVTSGIISSVVVNEVPFLDEKKFIIGKNSLFTVNKSNTVIGNYLTFTAKVDFKERYASRVNDIMLIIDLPEGCELCDNSVVIGHELGGYSVSGNQVMIPLTDYTKSVLLCAIPVNEGDYASSALVQFTLDGKTLTQPIGSAFFSADALSLSVPSVTADTEIFVSGNAYRGKTVKVYDGNTLIAQTSCRSDGRWQTKAELYNPTDGSIHHIHAVVETHDNYTLLTEVKDVKYLKMAPVLETIDMIYNSQDIEFNYANGTVSKDYYSFAPSITSFTFKARIAGGNPSNVHNLYFKILDNKGHIRTIPGTYASAGTWICNDYFSQESGLPINVTVVYDYVWNDENFRYEQLFTVYHQPLPCVEPLVDPSGFVYEAVPSNRLQGVMTTCYYRDENGNVVLWDAEQYGQQNPLFTDENGLYRWDVPIGNWQVKYEKEGYETTYSDWLPVPPPQLDVNIGMVQMTQPEVIKAHAYKKAVEFEFDKYMLPEDLNSTNIKVTDAWGSELTGTIELVNAEVDDPNAITSIRRSPGTGLVFVSKVRFIFNYSLYGNEVTLHVRKGVRSYAGVEMSDDYIVTLPVENEMTKIVVDPALDMRFGDSQQLYVTIEPYNAFYDKTLTVQSSSPMVVSTDAETYEFGNNGRALVTIHGDLPGMALLTFGIDGYDLTATTLVNVLMESDFTVATPIASIASGSQVDKGTEIYLSCATQGATIYYTTNGSDPSISSAARHKYNGLPIVINGNTTIKAIATKDGLNDSEVATFVYNVGSLQGDTNGDGEVNIADVNALIDVILGDKVNPDIISTVDVNGDGEVNIADINALIDIILNPDRYTMLKVNCEDMLHMGSVALRPGDVRTLQVTLDNASHYSAMQCDIVLPDGLTLVGVNAVNGNEGITAELDENSSRVVTYSKTKKPFDGSSQPVLSLTVRADAALAVESEMTLTNVVLADANNKAWRLADCTARVNNTSGIHDLTAGYDRVWVEGRTLCIDAREDGTAQVVTVNGMVQELNVKTGMNHQLLEPGIYVIVLNGKSHKIAIR